MKDKLMILRSLQSENLRLFFIGQGISLVGTWIQRIALPWMVYQKSGSSSMLGIVAFAGLAPTFIIAPFAGVFIDRWNRYRVVMAAQIFSLIQAFILTFFSFSGDLSMKIIIILSIFSGIINAFEMPARQVFMLELVENKNDYSNVLAINSIIVTAARLAGPSAAAMLIGLGGLSICFLFNGLSYSAVIISLMLMGKIPVTIIAKGTGLAREMKDGFAFAFGHHPVRNILLLYGLICFAGWPVTVLMPVIAGEMLHGSAVTFSILTAASGGGALAGAVFSGSRKNGIGTDYTIAKASAVFGIGIILISFSGRLILSIGLMAVTGACMMILMAATVSFIQSITEENKRGRIMSCYTMIFTGAAPAGSYLSGNLSASFGTPQILFVSGLLCFAGAIAFSTTIPRRNRSIKLSYE